MATDSTIASNLSDTLNNIAQTDVEEYQIRGRRVRRAHQSALSLTRAMLMLRGIGSSKRGLSVAKIEIAQS